MSSLDSLIRLHRWALDEKRQKLVGLERLHDRMQQDMQSIDAAMERESKAAGADPDTALSYPSFVASILDRRKKLKASIAELVRSVEAAREEVGEAYRDFKKYETAKANEDRRVSQRRQKREQSDADERALQTYRRRAAR